jgi:hypothetical protein
MLPIAILMVLIVLGLAAYWYLARRASPAGRKDAAARRSSTAPARFGAVEIRVRSGACAAARAFQGKRFLAQEAPALPLPDCTAPHCSCAFVKLSDRREDERRSEHEGLSAQAFIDNDRRARDDRRNAD